MSELCACSCQQKVKDLRLAPSILVGDFFENDHGHAGCDDMKKMSVGVEERVYPSYARGLDGNQGPVSHEEGSSCSEAVHDPRNIDMLSLSREVLPPKIDDLDEESCYLA